MTNEHVFNYMNLIIMLKIPEHGNIRNIRKLNPLQLCFRRRLTYSVIVIRVVAEKAKLLLHCNTVIIFSSAKHPSCQSR